MTEIALIDPNTLSVIEFRNPPPPRWTSPQGAVITGFDKLTPEQMAALNWYPVIREPLDEAHEAGSPIVDTTARTVTIPAVARDLALLKQEATAAVNEAAGRARLKYITAAPGQETTYQLKLQQAQACQAAGYPPDDGTNYSPGGSYGLIGAEMLANGWTDPKQAADFILNTAALWQVKAAHIEAERRKGVVAIGAAADGPAALAARDAAVAALEGL